MSGHQIGHREAARRDLRSSHLVQNDKSYASGECESPGLSGDAGSGTQGRSYQHVCTRVHALQIDVLLTCIGPACALSPTAPLCNTTSWLHCKQQRQSFVAVHIELAPQIADAAQATCCL